MTDDDRRVCGTVLWFAEERGWGVVVDGAGSRAFVDYAQIVGNGLRTLAAGQMVTYAVVETERGLVAERLEVDDRSRGGGGRDSGGSGHPPAST